MTTESASTGHHHPPQAGDRAARRGHAPGHRRSGAQARSRRCREHYPQADIEPVERGYSFAVEAHAGQKRAIGEPYISHPWPWPRSWPSSASTRSPSSPRCCTTSPRTPTTRWPTSRSASAPRSRRLVDGVTKLSKFGARRHEEQQAENIRKMFLAMAEDIRVVLIKLADRLHNMRTLERAAARQAASASPARRPRSTRRWPSAWASGRSSGSSRTSPSRILEPASAYQRLATQLETRRKAREAYVKRAMGILADALKAAGIEAELSGRPKHINSIWKKMQRKGADLTEIYDVHAMRVLVDERQGLLRRAGRRAFAVAADPGPVRRLHRDAQGRTSTRACTPPSSPSTASRSRCRSGPTPCTASRRSASPPTGATRRADGKSDRDYDAKLAWVRQLMDWQREVSDATEFVEGLKLDIFQDQVFVFTPKGDVKDLPAGSTPLDFAYRIHTDVGHRRIGAKVNNRLVPLDYKLKNGDIVEIVTTKGAHGPSRDWLDKVVAPATPREKIRQWFKRQERDENIVHGRENPGPRAAPPGAHVAREARLGDASPRWPRPTSSRRSTTSIAAIGYGAISAQQVVMRMGVVDDADEVVLPQVAPPMPGAHRRRPGQGRRRPDGPIREVLPSHPG